MLSLPYFLRILETLINKIFAIHSKTK